MFATCYPDIGRAGALKVGRGALTGETLAATEAWTAMVNVLRDTNFPRYMAAIAEARYVMRKISRIVDDEAKRHDLDPLEHHAIVQAYAARPSSRTVSQLAERMDVSPALASRIVNSLARKELVTRRPADTDKRVIRVEVSSTGEQLIRQIDHDVHVHVEYFQSHLTDSQRAIALGAFVYHLGLDDLPLQLSLPQPDIESDQV